MWETNGIVSWRNHSSYTGAFCWLHWTFNGCLTIKASSLLQIHRLCIADAFNGVTIQWPFFLNTTPLLSFYYLKILIFIFILSGNSTFHLVGFPGPLIAPLCPKSLYLYWRCIRLYCVWWIVLFFWENWLIAIFCVQPFPCHFFTLKCALSLKCYISPNFCWIILNLGLHTLLDVW